MFFNRKTFKQGVAEFWNWFSRHERRFYDTIEAGRCADLAKETGEAVDRWLGGLAWVYGPGLEKGSHSLTLSPEGILPRQFLTDYWLSQAPQFPRWIFHSSRQASKFSGGEIRIGPHSFTRDATWVSTFVDEQEEELDITLWHPLFSEIDEKLRGTVGFLWLDEMLGEHGTCMWIGEIKFSDNRLREAIPIAELPELIAQTAAEQGWKKLPPGQSCSVYQLPEPNESYLRSDTIAGTTCCMPVIHDYLEHRGKSENPLKNKGADFLFAAFSSGHLRPGEESASRGELEDALASVLTKNCDGQVIGGATGIRNSYIDVVAFDPPAATESMRKVLGNTLGRNAVRVERFYR